MDYLASKQVSRILLDGLYLSDSINGYFLHQTYHAYFCIICPLKNHQILTKNICDNFYYTSSCKYSLIITALKLSSFVITNKNKI